jgi:DNA-directed RNA polymerase subunit RPC12/RpoP
MSEIRLEDATINYEGEWRSADDLSRMIQEKMESGEMKFAGLASALEELNKAIENSQAIDVKLVITKEQYEKLKKLGGDDDNASVRKAIMAFIGGEKKKAAPSKKAAPAKKDAPKAEGKPTTIKCSKCKTPIEVTSDERPLNIECDYCGTSNLLEAEKKASEKKKPAPEGGKDEAKHKDHFIG